MTSIFLFLLFLGSGLIIKLCNKMLERTESHAVKRVIILLTVVAIVAFFFLAKWCAADVEAMILAIGK